MVMDYYELLHQNSLSLLEIRGGLIDVNLKTIEGVIDQKISKV